MSINKAYFIAKGRSLEAVQAWLAKRQAGLDAVTAIFNETGSNRARGNGAGLEIYMDSSDQKPAMVGWRRMARTSMGWVPDRKTAEGKALVQRLRSTYIPTGMELSVGCSMVIGDGMRCYSAVPEQVGDVLVIAVPYVKAEDIQTPWDAEPLKTSEFWAMKEAQEALKPQEAVGVSE